MDTNLLKIFITYSKTQNLRMTAEHHHTSHVAVIRAIKSLEELLGLKLTMRVGRGSMLTPEGKSLIKAAERIMTEEQNLLKLASNENSLVTELSIATFEVFSTHLAPEINKSLGLETKVSWMEKIPGEIEQAIRSGVADLGITYMPIPTPDIEHLKVSSIKMGIFQGRHSLFADKDISKVPFVVPIQDEYITPTKAKGLDGWPDYRIPRNVHYRVSLLESAFAMVAAGQCVGYFPCFVVDKYNASRKDDILKEVRFFKMKEPSQDVFLVKKINSEEGSLVKKVVRVLRALK